MSQTQTPADHISMEQTTSKRKFEPFIWNQAARKSNEMYGETCPVMKAEFDAIKDCAKDLLGGPFDGSAYLKLCSLVDKAMKKDVEVRSMLRKLHIGALAELACGTSQMDASYTWYENYERECEVRDLRLDAAKMKEQLEVMKNARHWRHSQAIEPQASA